MVRAAVALVLFMSLSELVQLGEHQAQSLMPAVVLRLQRKNDKFGSRGCSGRWGVFVSSALGDDGDGIAQSGATYIFLQAGSNWGVEQELSEPNFGIIDEDSWQSFKNEQLNGLLIVRQHIAVGVL